ncbi:hypothetical protein HMSSN036_13780 [Paenibacillus macerans]|nr:hypothetical protein HMSSN036_13780 [Paenibacillus macerans]
MKQIDLQPVTGMSPVIGLLHAMVRFNFLRLKQAVEGLTQKEIDYKGPKGGQNSIAQLIRHLTVVDLHWVYRLQKAEVPAEYTAKFGPMYNADGKLPMVKNVPLQTLLEDYEQIQEMLKEVCLKLDDDELLKEVPYENGNTATVRWGIWHIADHSRHHYAHIVGLKKG